MDNVEIRNNYLKMNGFGAYGIGATHSNYLKIISNTIKETPSSEGTSHVPILMGDCHHNIISNNNLEIIVKEPYTYYISLNGIYFSTYGSGVIDGGPCNYNKVTHNTIKGFDNIWCYTIQMMGNKNLAAYNTVSGGYIGISSAGDKNKIINNTINATTDGISVGNKNIVSGNIINVGDGATGISIPSDNCKIENNKIITTNKPGISLTGSKNILTSNNIKTESSNGIYIQGIPKNNNITKNKINSNGIGILFKQRSKNNCPTNTNLKNNDITTTATYAIDAYESENTYYSNNYLSSSKGTGKAAIRRGATNNKKSNTPTSNKKYKLNNNNYFKYFNADGTLKDNIGLKDTFNLNGPLYNKNMTINVPITINGNKKTIYNGTIKVMSNGAETTIKNLKIINKNQIGIILEDTENVNIENNDISVNQKIESYGIYLHGSEYNRILNNKITSRGDYVNFGIFLYSSNHNKVLKNKIHTISSDIEIPYQEKVMLNEKIGNDGIPQIFTTYGIIAIYSSNNNIDNNIVNLKSLFKKPKKVTENCSNSMVGIDIYYDSHYNTAKNNKVNVIGNNPYSYGMGVLGSSTPRNELETAKGNVFENNIIKVFGNYFATGFISGLGSVDTTIKNNIITAKSNTFTYGITFENSQRNNLNSNKITLRSPAIYGIEIFGSNKNKINKNSITTIGHYKYGIAGYASSKNEITNNNIKTKSTKLKTKINENKHKEVIRIGDTGIFLMTNSNANLIKLNKITTDSKYTITLKDSAKNKIIQNSLLAKKKIASNSITYNKKNTIKNNEGYSLKIYMKDLTSTPGSKITLKALVKSTKRNSNGLKVTFKIGITTIGTSITKNGIAKLTYKIPKNWKSTYYTLKASVSGKNYITKTVTKSLELKKPKVTKPKLTLKRIKTVSKRAKKLVLHATLKINNKLINGKKVTFIFKGKRYPPIKTNKKGIAKVIIKKSVLEKLKVGEKVTYQAKYTYKNGKKIVTQTVKESITIRK